MRAESRIRMPEGQAFGDRERVDQAEVLVDHPDAGGQSVAWGVDVCGIPFISDLTGIRLVQTRQDRAER